MEEKRLEGLDVNDWRILEAKKMLMEAKEKIEKLDVADETNWSGLRVERIVPLFLEIEKLELGSNIQEKRHIIEAVYHFRTKYKEKILFNVGGVQKERAHIASLVSDAEKQDKDTLTSYEILRLVGLRSHLEELSHFDIYYREIDNTINRAYHALMQSNNMDDHDTCSISTNDTTHDIPMEQHDYF